MTDERLRALNPYRPETSEHHAWAHGLATALAATPDWKVAKAECEAKTDPDNFARNLAATPEPTLVPCPWCGHPPMCHKGTEGECVPREPNDD